MDGRFDEIFLSMAAQHKAETLVLSPSDALEPSSAVQKRKATSRSPPSPKRIALHEEHAVVPSAPSLASSQLRGVDLTMIRWPSC